MRNLIDTLLFFSLFGASGCLGLNATCSADHEVTEFLQTRFEVGAGSNLSSRSNLSSSARDEPHYSCIGKDWKSSCYFHELCLDIPDFQLRTMSNMEPQLIYFSNGPLPFENMRLQVRVPFASEKFKQNLLYVNVQANTADRPEEAAISPDNSTVLIQTLAETNFGHQLDGAFSAYRMQQVFGIPLNARIMLLSDAQMLGHALVNKVFSLITQPWQEVANQTMDSSDFIEKLLRSSRNHKPQSRYLCFPNMVVGSGSFSFLHEQSAEQWWNYRGYCLSNVGNGNGIFHDDIVISRKTISVRFGNTLQADIGARLGEDIAAQQTYNHYLSRLALLHQRIESLFPSNSVRTVDYKDLPIKDQVLMTSNLKALITHRGGGSFVALFLPKGASLIATAEHDLGDDGFFASFFKPEDALWESLHWVYFVKVSDMLNGQVEKEVGDALYRQVQTVDNGAPWDFATHTGRTELATAVA